MENKKLLKLGILTLLLSLVFLVIGFVWLIRSAEDKSYLASQYKRAIENPEYMNSVSYKQTMDVLVDKKIPYQIPLFLFIVFGVCSLFLFAKSIINETREPKPGPNSNLSSLGSNQVS